jgi:hypothetical protein
VSPIEEFTYLSPNRFVGTTQAERKPHAESYWENGDAEFSAGLGGESFNHLLERVDAMRCWPSLQITMLRTSWPSTVSWTFRLLRSSKVTHSERSSIYWCDLTEPLAEQPV